MSIRASGDRPLIPVWRLCLWAQNPLPSSPVHGLGAFTISSQHSIDSSAHFPVLVAVCRETAEASRGLTLFCSISLVLMKAPSYLVPSTIVVCMIAMVSISNLIERMMARPPKSAAPQPPIHRKDVKLRSASVEIIAIVQFVSSPPCCTSVTKDRPHAPLVHAWGYLEMSSPLARNHHVAASI